VPRRWSYPAAIAVSVGVSFTAVAAATGERSAQHRPATASPGALKILRRSAMRLHETIAVQVHRLRAGQPGQPFGALPGGVPQTTLDAIGQCESGGDPSAVSADGTYRGKYQFDYGTWASVGGSGDPAAAPEAEQDYRAALLLERSGSSPWPNCA
jgi:Transglycosylase-like domain